MSGQPTEALALGETALAAHDKALGRDHPWTKDSARVTADALDALGRTEEAKALRERYGLTGLRDLKAHEGYSGPSSSATPLRTTRAKVKPAKSGFNGVLKMGGGGRGTRAEGRKEGTHSESGRPADSRHVALQAGAGSRTTGLHIACVWPLRST